MGKESNLAIQARELKIVQGIVMGVLAAQVLSTMLQATRTINVELTQEEHQTFWANAQDIMLSGTAASKNQIPLLSRRESDFCSSYAIPLCNLIAPCNNH